MLFRTEHVLNKHFQVFWDYDFPHLKWPWSLTKVSSLLWAHLFRVKSTNIWYFIMTGTLGKWLFFFGTISYLHFIDHIEKGKRSWYITFFFHNGEILSNFLMQNQSVGDLRMTQSYMDMSFCLSWALDVTANFAPFLDLGGVHVAANWEDCLRNTTVVLFSYNALPKIFMDSLSLLIHVSAQMHNHMELFLEYSTNYFLPYRTYFLIIYS